MVRFSDSELLFALRENERFSFVNLAKKFGVTETAIRKRIRSLEKKGIIKGYTINIDYKKLGFDITAIIGIDTLPEKLFQIIEDLKKEDVISIYTSSGDHMLLIEKCFKNTSELQKYIWTLQKKEDITKVCPAIIIDKIK